MLCFVCNWKIKRLIAVARNVKGSIHFILEKDGQPIGIWQASTEQTRLHSLCSTIRPYNGRYIIVGRIDGASLGDAYGMNSPKNIDILGKSYWWCR